MTLKKNLITVESRRAITLKKNLITVGARRAVPTHWRPDEEKTVPECFNAANIMNRL